MLRRPALSLAWSSSSADVPPPGPQPWRLGLVPREWWVAPAPEGNDDTGTGFPDSPFATLSKVGADGCRCVLGRACGGFGGLAP